MAYSNRPMCPGSKTIATKVIKAPGLNPDRLLGVCSYCGRVGALAAGGWTRIHSPRGDNTRSHDKTMEVIYLMHGGKLPNRS
jgi:hypothetical protein